MIELEFDWTDAGSPEDHACKLEAISERAGNRGRYQEATELHVAAQCIRGLNEETERLEAEVEALRETLKELRNSPEVSRELWLAVEGDKALAALAAHDKGGDV